MWIVSRVGEATRSYTHGQFHPVGKEFISDRYKAFGREKPPPIDHQAINDAFVGKGSEVLYFYKGRWLRLAGDD